MRKTILTIAAIIVAYVLAFSQSVTETRHIKTTALQVYENYKVVTSGLYSKSAYTEDNFMALFESNALIYNDILPDNKPQQLSPSNYFKKFSASIRRIYPVFSDFKMGEPVSVGNKWQIKCNFARGARFLTQKDMKYPEWSFNYIMTVEMDKSYNTINKVYENARIVSIDVDKPLKGFFIIENKENTPLLAKSGEMLKDWDEEYHSRIFPETKWKISDIRVSESINKGNFFESSKGKFSKNQTDANFYKLDVQRFNKDIFGIGVNSSPLTLSFFYGKQIAHKEKSTVFFNIGLDLNKYSHNCSGDTIYETWDSDHDRYKRIVKINSLKEKNLSVSVPLSVQYLHQLSQQTKNPIFLSFELGVFAEYTLSSNYDLNADYSGLYTFTFNDNSKQYVVFDHYYDYGKNIRSSGELNLANRFAGGIFGSAGLWLAINRSNLLKFNISYKYSSNLSLKSIKNYDNLIKTYTTPEEYTTLKKDMDLYHLLNGAKQGMQNMGIGISWVKTIGRK